MEIVFGLSHLTSCKPKISSKLVRISRLTASNSTSLSRTDFVDVIVEAGISQGSMYAKYVKSVFTFRANPWKDVQFQIAASIEAIFLF